MAWELGDAEYESVRTLPDEERYEYFVSRVADTQRLWGLKSPGGDWAFATDEDGTEVVAVWPHERYAGACADGPWADDGPEAISLEDWFARWTPGLERDGHGIAVFPTADGAGARVTPARLRRDLEQALSQY